VKEESIILTEERERKGDQAEDIQRFRDKSQHLIWGMLYLEIMKHSKGDNG
jgi:hypothetical protein